MIDIHSHILPNIDDGAYSIEETYKMVEEAKNAGITKIVATPHYIEDYYTENVNKYSEVLNEIQQKTGVKLYIGNEVYLSRNVIKLLKQGKISTINNTKYILFEMPLNLKPMNYIELIREMLDYNLIPILAHPERYSYIQKDMNVAEELAEMGVLFQANYGSLIGMYGKEAKNTVKKLLKYDMVHFFATDAHKANTVYEFLPDVLKKLKKLVDGKKFEEIVSGNAGKFFDKIYY